MTIEEILKEAWRNLEVKFSEHPLIGKDKEPEEKVAWDEESALRNLGSEGYFQAAFFSELEKVIHNNNQNLIIGLEGKDFAGKSPDVYLLASKEGYYKPKVLIELKVTGFDLLDDGEEGLYLKDLKRYFDIDMLREEGSILVFGCYYESKSEEILEVIDRYGSLINWVKETKNIDLPVKFTNSIIELYGFI